MYLVYSHPPLQVEGGRGESRGSLAQAREGYSRGSEYSIFHVIGFISVILMAPALLSFCNCKYYPITKLKPTTLSVSLPDILSLLTSPWQQDIQLPIVAF